LKKLYKKKILVVGGSGFLGTNIIKKLDKKKNLISSTKFSNKIFYKFKNIKYSKGDLRDLDFCRKITNSMDIVFMCSAVSSGAKDIEKTPMLHVDDNVKMNLNIIKAAAENKIKKFIFFSSNVVYPNHKKPMSESDLNYSLFKKYFNVGWMKIFSEKLCEMYKDKMTILIVRPANLYGPHDKFDPLKSKVIPSLIKKFEEKKIIKVWGNGDDIKDFMYIEDFVDALLLIVKKYKKFTIINIGTGKSIKLKKIINFLIKYYSKTSIIFDKKKPTMVPIRRINIKKFQNLTKYKLKFSIEKGLEKTIKWYRDNS
jgi:nucleoside-diphosphate-sugar epimerase